MRNYLRNLKIKKLHLLGIANWLIIYLNYFGIILVNFQKQKNLKKIFKICIGDQSNPVFWKNFYKKFGKIDILIDDGGHTNLQQITTLMESINHINYGGMIVVEDTHL